MPPHDPVPDSALHVTVALLLRDVNHAARLEPMQRTRRDRCCRSELTNAEAGEGTGSGELLTVVSGDVGAHPCIMMRIPIVSIVPLVSET